MFMAITDFPVKALLLSYVILAVGLFNQDSQIVIYLKSVIALSFQILFSQLI